jgi:hypothetical protein
VEALPTVDEADERVQSDEAAPASETDSGSDIPPAPPMEGAIPPAPPLPESNLTNELKKRLTVLVPQIKIFAAAADDAGKQAGADLEAKKAALAPKNNLLTLVRDCKGMMGKNTEQAEAMLGEIETILKQGQGDIPPAPPMSNEMLADQFKSRLTALVPQIKQAAGTDAAEVAKVKAKEAAAASGNQNFEQANQLLDQVEQALDLNSGNNSAARAKKLAEALKKLKPLMDQTITADPNRKGELQSAMVQIDGHIKAQELDQAKQSLVEFATLLSDAAPPVAKKTGEEMARGS